jgi:cytochrome c biogenesis protein CcmG/thiol:disulfide interchange protein DsbE
LVTLDGKTVTSADLRGKPTVVNFWSTWCVPCKTEHDILQMGSKRYGDRVQFIGVIYQDTAEAARQYLTTRKNYYPQLVDTNAGLAIQFGVSGVPESFFVDPQGIVRHKEVGPVSPMLLADQIAQLSASASGAMP